MDTKKEITVEVGYEQVIIDKLYGPMSFANLRITADPERGWIIERQTLFPKKDSMTWVEWCCIPGQFDWEYGKDLK